MIARISDPDDPQLADYRAVPDPVLLRERGLFVAEGRLVVRRLLTRSPYRVRSILVTDAALAAVADVRGEIPTFLVSQAVMNAVGGFNFHRGCLALGERPREPLAEELLAGLGGPAERRAPVGDEAARPAPLAADGGVRSLVVAEGVGNADNVGAIFRNAAAFGARAVLLGPGCCDPLYRKAIRTSMGAALWLPFGHFRAWPADLAHLRARGFALVALTPRADAMDLARFANASGRPRRLALLVGAEGSGLSEEALGAADVQVRIPIASDVESLNVATALAIALARLAEEDRRPS